MKVGELLEGIYDDARDEYYPSDSEQADLDAGEEAAKEEFYNRYIELDGSTAGQYEDIGYVMKEILSKRHADFREAQQVIGELNSAFRKKIELFIPRNIEERINELWNIINGEDGNADVVERAIQEFFALIKQGMTTEDEWMNSKEAHAISSDAAANYEPDSHSRHGVKPKDFY